jgi:hypothetical protein
MARPLRSIARHHRTPLVRLGASPATNSPCVRLVVSEKFALKFAHATRDRVGDREHLGWPACRGEPPRSRQILQVASIFAVPAVGSTACEGDGCKRRASAVPMQGKTAGLLPHNNPVRRAMQFGIRDGLLSEHGFGANIRARLAKHRARLFAGGHKRERIMRYTLSAHNSVLRFPCNAYEKFLVVQRGALPQL